MNKLTQKLKNDNVIIENHDFPEIRFPLLQLIYLLTILFLYIELFYACLEK